MLDERYRTILEARTRRPEAIAEAAARRARPATVFNEHGRLMMIAADHRHRSGSSTSLVGSGHRSYSPANDSTPSAGWM